MYQLSLIENNLAGFQRVAIFRGSQNEWNPRFLYIEIATAELTKSTRLGKHTLPTNAPGRIAGLKDGSPFATFLQSEYILTRNEMEMKT